MALFHLLFTIRLFLRLLDLGIPLGYRLRRANQTISIKNYNSGILIFCSSLFLSNIMMKGANESSDKFWSISGFWNILQKSKESIKSSIKFIWKDFTLLFLCFYWINFREITRSIRYTVYPTPKNVKSRWYFYSDDIGPRLRILDRIQKSFLRLPSRPRQAARFWIDT